MSLSELRFLVDVGVGKAIETFLHQEGYDTKAVRDINPRLEDEAIIRIAVSESRMIITMDKDFGELVYHSNMSHCGVLLLRMEDAAGQEKLKVIQNIMRDYAGQIKDSFCVFQSNKFRIRKAKSL